MTPQQLYQKLMRNKMRPEAPEGHFLELLVSRCAKFEFDERLTFSEVVGRLACCTTTLRRRTWRSRGRR